MKKNLLLACIAIIFFSCSKSSNSSNGDDYFIRFKVDNRTIDISVDSKVKSLVWGHQSEMGLYTINITGTNFPSDAGNLKDMINLTVFSNEPVKANYDYHMHEPAMANGNPVPSIQVVFADDQGKIFNASILRNQSIVTPNDAYVRFTEIGDKHVRGVFTATLVNPSDFSITKSITDGEFYLQLMRP